MVNTASSLSIVEGNKEVETLAQKLITHQAIPEMFSEDAYHVAFAIVYQMDFLLSWNFKHIVRRKTKDIVRMLITAEGYRYLEIVTPPELL